jgi:hypothetical protein
MLCRTAQMALALERMEDGTADDATRMQLQGGVYKTDHTRFNIQPVPGSGGEPVAASEAGGGAGLLSKVRGPPFL